MNTLTLKPYHEWADKSGLKAKKEIHKLLGLPKPLSPLATKDQRLSAWYPGIDFKIGHKGSTWEAYNGCRALLGFGRITEKQLKGGN